VKRWTWQFVAVVCLGLALPTTGQHAATVLDLDPCVRMLGAGSAGLSVTSGAETLYYNPAGLAALPGISFSSFYASHLGLANYSAASVTLRNWGLAVLSLGSSGIEGYDETGNPTGSIAYRNTGVLFGVGLDPSTVQFLPRLPLDFSLGGRVKYVSTRIAGERGSGFSVDLGFRLRLGEMHLGPISLTETALGITGVNLLGGMSYDTESEPFRAEVQVGLSTRVAQMVLLALDLHTGGSTHVGLVYSVAPTFDLRVGMISRSSISFTLGAGLNVEGILLDYAFVSHSLGGTHRVSLTLDFSSLDMVAFSNSLRRILP
jgi:hypothetical protein